MVSGEKGLGRNQKNGGLLLDNDYGGERRQRRPSGAQSVKPKVSSSREC